SLPWRVSPRLIQNSSRPPQHSATRNRRCFGVYHSRSHGRAWWQASCWLGFVQLVSLARPSSLLTTHIRYPSTCGCGLKLMDLPVPCRPHSAWLCSLPRRSPWRCSLADSVALTSLPRYPTSGDAASERPLALSK